MPSLLSEIMCFSLVCIWCSSTVESHYNKYLGHYKFFTLSEIYCIQLTFYNRTFTWAHVFVLSFHCLRKAPKPLCDTYVHVCITWVETCLLFAYFYAFEWLVFKISIGIKHRKKLYLLCPFFDTTAPIGPRSNLPWKCTNEVVNFYSNGKRIISVLLYCM
jgi:hypothetical protein